MIFFKRQKSIEVYKNENLYIAKVKFEDVYHNFELICKASFELEILDSEIILLKKPYNVCDNIFKFVERVHNVRIEKGFMKKIAGLVGGREGCTHLVDMFQEIARGLVQSKIEDIKNEKGLEGVKEFLKGECIAY